MNKTSKLFVFGAIGLVLVLGIVVVAVVLIFKFGAMPRLDAMKNEGTEFGKTTDEQGCLDEGFSRARKLAKKGNILDEVGNPEFVSGCLRSSKSTNGFCNDVPEGLGGLMAKWQEQRCATVDAPLKPCREIFKEVWIYCGNLKRGLVPGKSITPAN